MRKACLNLESRRGRAHDAEGAREAILNAAEAVFAEHGFDGARIDAIAAISRLQQKPDLSVLWR